MTFAAVFLAGFLAGAALLWLIATLKLRKTHAEETSALNAEMRASAAKEAELRHLLERRDAELSGARASLDSLRQEKTASETRLDEAQKSFEEQKALIETMKAEMKDTFNALSSAALKSSSEDFLKLASENLGRLLAETKGKLGEHQARIDGLVKPLHEALKRYEEQIFGIELKRKQEYTSLDEQIKGLAQTHERLQRETGNLVTALRKPHVRGRWGEITLRNVVELAGMSSHCDFTEQLSIETESGRLRPDMIIHLPMGRDIVVDSKVSMEALLDAVSADSEEKRQESVKRHAKNVKDQIGKLVSKQYWSQFEKSPELAVLFISESALVSALEVDGSLMEESMSKRVLLATPTTLFALLSAVAYGWRQEEITKNAEEISRLGKELYERVHTFAKHLSTLGGSLKGSVDAYNKAVGSMESRILPSVRRFRELGVSGPEEIPRIEDVEQTPRNLPETEQ